MCRFLPAPSARRATLSITQQPASINISIHALREEGDHLADNARRGRLISIHALREEGDLRGVLSAPSALHFYPRPPRGGRQLCPALFPDVMGISIHALREEGDSGWKPRPPLRCNFYPRPPRGGRPPAGVLARWSIRFLSTPSARRATYFHLPIAI